MTLSKLLFIPTLFCFSIGYAQILELHFDQPVELESEQEYTPTQLEYTVEIEYFDHAEKSRKKKFLFLTERKSLSYDFDQKLPTEVEVSFNFRKSSHRFPLLLRPKNKLKITIQQLVDDEIKMIQNEYFFKTYFKLQGKDADLNKALIRNHQLIKVDDYIYNNLIYKNQSLQKDERKNKFIQTAKNQIDNFDNRIELLDDFNFKEADYIKNYMKDKHRMKVTHNVLHKIYTNNNKLGFDSLSYYQLVDYLFHLNGNNHYIEEYFYRAKQIMLYGDDISSRYLYARSIPFEEYMNSDAFFVSPEWDSIYQKLKSTDGSTLSNAITELDKLKGKNVKGLNIRAIMMNDLFYNGVVYSSYYRDSLFINYLSSLELAPEIKLPILQNKLIELNTDGLRDIGSHSGAAGIHPYKMSASRHDLYAKALKAYDRKLYEDNLNFYYQNVRRIVEEGSYADSIPVISSDRELYNFALPRSSKLTVLIILGETYQYSIDFKISLMQELQKQLGSEVDLVVGIDWGRRGSKHIVNEVLEQINHSGVRIKSCVLDHSLNIHQYNKGNMRFPLDYVLLTSDGFMPPARPKGKSYFDYPAVPNPEFANDSLSFSQRIDQILKLNSSELEEKFNHFLENTFTGETYWYSTKNDRTLLLSKNYIHTIYSTKPELWKINMNETSLRIFEVDERKELGESEFQLNKEQRAISINGVKYTFLFYDNEQIVFTQESE